MKDTYCGWAIPGARPLDFCGVGFGITTTLPPKAGRRIHTLSSPGDPAIGNLAPRHAISLVLVVAKFWRGLHVRCPLIVRSTALGRSEGKVKRPGNLEPVLASRDSCYSRGPTGVDFVSSTAIRSMHIPDPR